MTTSNYLGLILVAAATALAFFLQRKRVAAILYIFVYALTSIGTLLQIGAGNLNYGKPLGLAGDDLQVINFAKNYINGFGFRLNPNLGFPGVMNNDYFPTFDFSYRLILRLFAIFSDDAFFNYDIMYIVGIIIMTLAALISLRRVGFSHWLSIIGANVFVVSPYFIFRAGVHDFLSMYYSAPFGAALAVTLGLGPGHQTVRKVLATTFNIVAVSVIATSGLYYAFFSSMFLALGAVLRSIQKRNAVPIIAATILIALIFFLMVVTGYGSGLVKVLEGQVPQVHRVAIEQLSYGLNLSEALHVLTDIPGLHRFIEPYMLYMNQMGGANGLFDWPGLTLTVTIMLSPIILILVGPTRLSQSMAPVYVAAACATFGLFFAVRGGLGYYFNLFITPQIRAPDRILPFLSFFALVILLSVITYALEARNAFVRVMIPMTLIVALVGSMLPSENGLALKQVAMATNQLSRADDIASVNSMLRSKNDSNLDVVLQLPVVAWPEADPQRSFQPYDHQLPFILDRPHSSTRWSYGGTSFQDSFKALQSLIDLHKEGGLASSASTMGFDAIEIEKTAYTKEELNSLQISLTSSDKCLRSVYDDAYRTLFAIVNPVMQVCK